MNDHVHRVCFYGPESTGKSTLARELAEVYHTQYVPEVAREMITSNESLTPDDIIRIGLEQTRRTVDLTKSANGVLFCDTDLITTQIYSRIYLNYVPPVLLELEKTIHYELYFLFNIDVPWVDDGLRDLGHRRQELYALFRDALVERGIPYIDVRGSFAEREKIIRMEVDRLLS